MEFELAHSRGKLRLRAPSELERFPAKAGVRPHPLFRVRRRLDRVAGKGLGETERRSSRRQTARSNRYALPLRRRALLRRRSALFCAPERPIGRFCNRTRHWFPAPTGETAPLRTGAGTSSIRNPESGPSCIFDARGPSSNSMQPTALRAEAACQLLGRLLRWTHVWRHRTPDADQPQG